MKRTFSLQAFFATRLVVLALSNSDLNLSFRVTRHGLLCLRFPDLTYLGVRMQARGKNGLQQSHPSGHTIAPTGRSVKPKTPTNPWSCVCDAGSVVQKVVPEALRDLAYRPRSPEPYNFEMTPERISLEPFSFAND